MDSAELNDNVKAVEAEEITAKECRLRWSPTSKNLLKTAEEKILSFLKTPYKGRFVNVGPVTSKSSKDAQLWTLSLNDNYYNNSTTSENFNNNTKTPVVLIHGLCSGTGLWSLNLDAIAKDNRPVYAFDNLGFGRSSRPTFSTDAMKTETEYVEAIEAWRKEMKLDRFVLLGHSMGGYLVTAYALRYPERVSHLVLADPWGFPEKPADPFEKFNLKPWTKMLFYALEPLNPLWALRAAGPFGPGLIYKTRPDLVQKFSGLSGDSEEADTGSLAADYIFHCNAQKPAGESAFHNLMASFAWAKNPMVKRVPELDKNLPITLIYGGRSWIDLVPGEEFQQLRPLSYVDVNVMKNAGHHVYADDKDEFNDLVLKAAKHADDAANNSQSNGDFSRL